MNIQEVEQLLISKICEIQNLSGRPVPEGLSGDFIPIGQMDGFDSQNAVEVCCMLTDQINYKSGTNPFVEGTRPLTIRQIAKNVMKKSN